MRSIKREALAELAEIIEDVFYTADLLRMGGDQAAATRLGEIGQKMHEEYMKLAHRPGLS